MKGLEIVCVSANKPVAHTVCCYSVGYILASE